MPQINSKTNKALSKSPKNKRKYNNSFIFRINVRNEQNTVLFEYFVCITFYEFSQFFKTTAFKIRTLCGTCSTKRRIYAHDSSGISKASLFFNQFCVRNVKYKL